MRRSEQRRQAVWALYQQDLTGRPLGETIPRDSSKFTRELALAVEWHRPDLDETIGRLAKGWTLDRIAPLERAILRVALLELLFPDEAPADQPIPPAGAIDEAVETAKEFCGADAPKFVNGILAAALREHQAGHAA